MRVLVMAEGARTVFSSRTVIAAAATVVLAAAWLAWQVLQWPNQPLRGGILEVNPGMHAAALGRRLAERHGAAMPTWLFRSYVRAIGVADQLQAGEYAVRDGESLGGVIARIAKGEVVQRRVALIEGWTFRQVLAALHRSPRLAPTLRGKPEAEVRALLGIARPHLEGLFLPDTYSYAAGMRDIDVLRIAHRRLENELARAWAARTPGLPYVTPYEALIMASIVEKETGRADDRDDIAGVFVRRLRLGMLLQTDPTVIYAVGESFDGNLKRSHLQLDHPHNTYVYPGLPPTPIALAGPAALRAALHPASSDALYFVARGDGSSQFSATLREHENAVDRYQRGGGS